MLPNPRGVTHVTTLLSYEFSEILNQWRPDTRVVLPLQPIHGDLQVHRECRVAPEGVCGEVHAHGVAI